MEQTQLQIDSERVQFGDWCFCVTDGSLKNAGASTRLQPRIEKLLTLFLSRPNQLLAREVLIDCIWGDKVVNEDALSRCIAELRALLGDSSSQPKFIETIPKKGYRFICPVTPIQSESPVKSNGDHKSEQNSETFFAKGALIGLASLVLLIVVSLVWFAYPEANPQMSASIKESLLSAKRITVDTEPKLQPDLSHDGDKIAYVIGQGEDWSIVIIDQQGRELDVIREPGSHLMSPKFSPSDQELLIAQFSAGVCNLYRYVLSSKQRHHLAECASSSASSVADWSPSGRYIAYTGPAQNEIADSESNRPQTSIWLFDLSTGASAQLTQPEEEQLFDSSPTFSPDGQTLSFVRGTTSTRNIYLVDVEPESLFNSTQRNSAATPVTFDSAYINHVEWLSDSRHLIFDSNKNGERNLWLLNRNTLKHELLGARGALSPTLDRDNQGLVFKEVNYNANIWQLNMTEGAAMAPLIESIRYNNFPTYSPDGKQVAFVSNRKGKPSIWLYDVDAKTQSEIVQLPAVELVNPSWSPDGQSLLISSRGPDGYACYRFSVTSQTFEVVGGIARQHFGCVEGPDGILYGISREPDEPSFLFQLDQNQVVTPLTETSVNQVAALADGGLIYSSPETKGIYLLQASGGEAINLVPDYKNSWSVHWAVSRTALYFARFKAVVGPGGKTLEPGLYRKDLTTFEERWLSAELPNAIGNTIAVHPNQSSILLTKSDRVVMNLYYAQIQAE